MDLIISCGDLDPSYLEFLESMTNVPLLYVHGNHDHVYEKTPPEGCIPIDNAPVDGTPFDLRQGVKLADGFAFEKENEQMTLGSGYDHNFVLSGQIDLTGLRRAAVVTDRISGRVLSVYTDMPAMQLYTANHLRRYNAQEKRWYGKRKALCLETQCTPDSIHHAGEDGFDVMTVDKDRPFHSSTVYAFGIVKAEKK